MIEQLKTIREALLLRDMKSCEEALAALTQLEAMVAGQEPVAWAMPKGDGTFIDVITPAEHAREEGSYTVPLFAHPVAQQPQAEAVPKDVAKKIFDLACSYASIVQINYPQDREVIDIAARTLKREIGALLATPQQVEAVPPDVARDAAPIPDHELVTMYDERPTSDLEMIEFAREVERRHGIGVQPQHITDGSPCWCNPDVAYTDPETSASVIVHRRPQ